MTNAKLGNCPYCDFEGELVWHGEEYVCEECRDKLVEDDFWEDTE